MEKALSLSLFDGTTSSGLFLKVKAPVAWFADILKYGSSIFVITSTATLVCLVVFYKAFIRADFSNVAMLKVR